MGWLQPAPIDDGLQPQSRAPSHRAPKSEPGADPDGANAPDDQRLADEPMSLPAQPYRNVTCNVDDVSTGNWQPLAVPLVELAALLDARFGHDKHIIFSPSPPQR